MKKSQLNKIRKYYQDKRRHEQEAYIKNAIAEGLDFTPSQYNEVTIRRIKKARENIKND